jgi:phosphoglycerol transferase MdoB-like AlkP superfamily enzyme
MKTRTGVAFMMLFNSWYYSFSPSLASYLGTHETQRELFGYTLVPLIGLLYASYYTYVLISPLNNEVAALTAGLVAAAMIGFVYLAPALYMARRILRRKTSLSARLNPRLLFALPVASSVATIFSYSAGAGLVLGFAEASLLLSILTLGVLAGVQVLKRMKFTYLTQHVAALNETVKTLTICGMKVLNSLSEE